MKTIRSLITLLAALAGAHAAPTEIARESFDGTPGSIGFTTSVPQFIELATSPLTDYFSIIPNNGTKISGNRTLPGADGASIFAAEDCDTTRTAPGVQGPQEVSLTTNAVNIAGKINTQVRLLMAAPGRDTAGTVNLAEYENFSNAPLFINKLRVEASIDGGAFQRVVQFSPSVIDFPTTLSFDADGNNVGGDANPIPTNPTALDATLREGIYSIPTGNTVQIRITLESDATGELIVFDYIRIFGESPATNPPVLAGVPVGNLVFTEGGAAAAIAPALTVTDSDSANLTSASVVISQALVSAEDVLAATPSGAILAGDIVYTAATGTLAITRTASLATYQAVLRSVTYRNTNLVNPSTSVRRVTFLASDGANSSNAPIRDINVVDNIVTQAIPFVESFETDGRGTRYSVDGGFSSPPSMFARVQPGAVAGLDGTFAFGVENVDDNSDFTELVTFNLNAAALVNLTGQLRVAAGGGPVYDNNATVPDFLRVEVSADGGAFQNVLAFYADAAAAGNMRQDTTPNDATNAGDGTLLTAALQTFTFNLPSATTLTVRIRAFTNIVGENILFDRLAVQGTTFNPVITSAADSGAGSLRQVLAEAAAIPGANTLTFAAALNGGTITLTSGEIVIGDTAGVTVDATALAAGVTVDGGAGTNRIFSVNGGATLNLIALTLTGGNGTGSFANDAGGAIFNAGTAALDRCTLAGNSSTSIGGAFYNGGNATLTRCTLASNSSAFGGALINYGNATLTHCTVSANNASANGGGIDNGNGGGIVLTLANSIVAGNTASLGADLYNFNGTVTRVGANLVPLYGGVAATGSGTISTAAPLLAPLGPYGGPTQTMVLLPASPARNASAGSAATSDQRGFPIVGVPDIGAYEAGTLNNFNAWTIETTGSALAFTVDGEKDGAANGLEYATRRNPLASDTPLAPTLTGPPGARLFTFRYRAAARDLRYIVQRSTDLANVNGWLEIYRYDASTGVITETGVTGDENAGTEVITLTDPIGGTKLFWRLRIELVP